jgi:hypothetical protein
MYGAQPRALDIHAAAVLTLLARTDTLMYYSYYSLCLCAAARHQLQLFLFVKLIACGRKTECCAQSLLFRVSQTRSGLSGPQCYTFWLARQGGVV